LFNPLLSFGNISNLFPTEYTDQNISVIEPLPSIPKPKVLKRYSHIFYKSLFKESRYELLPTKYKYNKKNIVVKSLWNDYTEWTDKNAWQEEDVFL
jgi:hypothetical protein